jgi:hypothetical protein
MKRSDQQKWFVRGTSAGGAAIGAGIGTALGGPLGAVIGGTAGVALPWVLEALPSQAQRAPVIGRWRRRRTIIAEVKRKLQLEFGESVPSDPENRRDLLQTEARLIASTPDFDLPDASERIFHLPSPRDAPASAAENIELLRKASPILVATPSICPSTVSVFKLLALQFQQIGVDLQIDFSCANSGDISKRYLSERWHFCAMCRLAIVVTDREVDKMLRSVAPLFSVEQYMLCRPVPRRTRRVLFVRDSPSEAQYWIQQDKHQAATIDYIAQTEIIRTAETLRDDEYIIIWEPAASFMEREYNLDLLKDTKFRFLISLLVSSQWATQHGVDGVSAFYNAFRHQWDFGSQNIDGMLWLLTSDPAYLKAFSTSVGLAPI